MIGSIGLKIGKLTAIRLARIATHGKANRRVRYWLCRCECGNELEVSEKRLGFGSGCVGCAHSGSKNSKFAHGETVGEKTSEYRAWAAMKVRCHNPNFQQFKDYGGRGIVVCERWRDSFENFLADMGRKPTPEHTIDRWPNKDGNYEPGNCRWATDSEQRRNRRTNLIIECGGRKMCLADWAAETGLDRRVIRYRLRAGWPIEEVMKA